MASTEQLRNYLETLSIAPGSCRGFEDEALGACIGLVGWGTAGMSSRSSWMQAVTAASFNTSGGTTAGPSNKSFFYVALRHRQNSAFGPFGFSTPDWNTFDVADFPWALPEPLFRQLYPDVMADKGRTYERPPTWDDVQAVGKAIGLSGPAGALGKKLFKNFLVKYVPALAESAAADWAGPVSAGGLYAAIKVGNFAARTHNKQTQQAFQVDAKRRDFDRAVVNAVAAR